MQRINNLLQKISELAAKTGEPEIIDIDLMMDYTKVIYADLLEMRGRIAFNSSLAQEQPTPKIVEAKQPEAVAEPEIIIDDNDETPAFPEDTRLEDEVELDIKEQVVSTSPQPFAPTMANTGDSDIRRIIGINDKYLLISELFNSNANAYEEVLNKLNSFGSYPQAIGWLDEVHSENNWNDDNENVVLFYNLVNHYFASK